MRLIDTWTLEFEDFFGKPTPAYAILSHTWGEGEVEYQNYHDRMKEVFSTIKNGSIDDVKNVKDPGCAKVVGLCKLALNDEYKYVWIDTCCIDKRNSSELSEAIRSMFKWYKESTMCYVYLSDVKADSWSTTMKQMVKSRWLRRGWTLQEWLSPEVFTFVDKHWSPFLYYYRFAEQDEDNVTWLGSETPSKEHLSSTLGRLAEVANIEARYLASIHDLEDISVAEKFSWSALRTTSRPEDVAYCLLGLFGIDLQPMYGEGERALVRLQEAIAGHSDDHTLFIWPYGLPFTDISALGMTEYGVFSKAITPLCNGHKVRRIPVDAIPWYPDTHYSVTNKGVHIDLPYLPLPRTSEQLLLIAFMCTDVQDYDEETKTHRYLLAMPVRRDGSRASAYYRSGSHCKPVLVPKGLFEQAKVQSLYLLPKSTTDKSGSMPCISEAACLNLHDQLQLYVTEIYPPNLSPRNTRLKRKRDDPVPRQTIEMLRPPDVNFIAYKLSDKNMSIDGSGSIFVLVKMIEVSNEQGTQFPMVALVNGKGSCSLHAFILQKLDEQAVWYSDNSFMGLSCLDAQLDTFNFRVSCSVRRDAIFLDHEIFEDRDHVEDADGSLND